MIDKLKLFPKAFLYSFTRGWGYPITKSMNPSDQVTIVPKDIQLDTDLIKNMARFPMISMTNTPFGDYREDIVRLLRKENPRIKILGYGLFVDAFPYIGPDTFYGQIWQGASALPNGLLYATDGSLFTVGYRLNFGNKDLLNLLIKVWGDQVKGSGQFDGFFMDYCAPQMAWTSSNTPGNKVLDVVRAGFPDLQANDAAREANFGIFINAMKKLGRSDFLYLGNAGMPQDMINTYLDGNLYEGWPAFEGGTDHGIEHLIQNPRPYNIIKVETGFTPYSREWSQQARYGLACSCMADCWFTYGYQDLNLKPVFMSWWWDELSVTLQPGYLPCYADLTGANTGWLGETVAPAFKTPEGLWRRDFPHGIVLLNSTSQPITINTVVTYKWINGKTDPWTNHGGSDHVFTVPPNDGLFLVSIPRISSPQSRRI